MSKMMKTIVISAVNIRRGGTLRILRDCLEYLSSLSMMGLYRVVAVVHKKEFVEFEGIEYIEMPDIIKGWGKRLWCEYVTMYKLSKKLDPVYLWFSLHDTTPRVCAQRQALYCQTSFPFLKLKAQDFKFDYKIVLFGLFTRFAYLINVKRNSHIVVQADWLRERFSRMFGVDKSRFIVAPPQETPSSFLQLKRIKNISYTFSYVCGPDCHKNVELLCEAAKRLERKIGKNKFKVILTLSGNENKYSRWLHDKWGNVDSVNFLGYQSREGVEGIYSETDCLVFPSRVETWGLPISEFRHTGKSMLLADLPYAHEASAGADKVGFFSPINPEDLMMKMFQLIEGKEEFLVSVSHPELAKPSAYSWQELFAQLLS